MKHSKSILLIFTALLMATTVHAAKMYRYVDKDGNVHYTDKPPPEAAQQERTVLNERGMETDTLDRQLTDEEVAEKKRLDEIEAAKQHVIEEREKRDEMLRQSYTSVADMENARDSRITAIEAQVLVTSRTISTLEQRLSGAEAQAKRLKTAGNEVPAELQELIDTTRDELLKNQKSLMASRTKQETIRHEFGEDIERFKELTGK